MANGTAARKRWAPREHGRFGGIVDPLLHWAKVETARSQAQVETAKEIAQGIAGSANVASNLTSDRQ